MPVKVRALVLNDLDNVAVALDDIVHNTLISVRRGNLIVEVKAKQDIPFAHKFAIANVQRGCPVLKYGETMGIATRQIKEGEHVHIHNVESVRGKLVNNNKKKRRVHARRV